MSKSTTILASIIIPVKNDHRIFRLIFSLRKQLALTSSFEVIIACNGSTHAFKTAIEKSFNHLPNSHCISIKESHIALAKNAGIRKSLGEFLYFLDSDCSIEASFIQDLHTAISKLATKGNTVAVGTNIFKTKNNSSIGVFDTKLRTTAYVKNARRAFTPNLLVPRKIFYTFGLFPEITPRIHTGEDSIWGSTVTKKGVAVIQVEKPQLTHYSYESDASILKGWIRYAEARCYRIYFDIKSNGNSILPTNYILKALGKPNSVQGEHSFGITLVLIFYYLLRATGVITTSIAFIFSKQKPTILLPQLKKKHKTIKASHLLQTTLTTNKYLLHTPQPFTTIIRTHEELTAQIPKSTNYTTCIKKINLFFAEKNFGIHLQSPKKSLDMYSTLKRDAVTVRCRIKDLEKNKKKGSIIISEPTLCKSNYWDIHTNHFPVKQDSVIFIPSDTISENWITTHFFAHPEIDTIQTLVFKKKYHSGYVSNSETHREKKIRTTVYTSLASFLDSPSISVEYQISTIFALKQGIPVSLLEKYVTKNNLCSKEMASFLQKIKIEYSLKKVQKIEIENAGDVFVPFRDRLVESLFAKKGFFDTQKIPVQITTNRTVQLIN